MSEPISKLKVEKAESENQVVYMAVVGTTLCLDKQEAAACMPESYLVGYLANELRKKVNSCLEEELIEVAENDGIIGKDDENGTD